MGVHEEDAQLGSADGTRMMVRAACCFGPWSRSFIEVGAPSLAKDAFARTDTPIRGKTILREFCLVE